MTDTIDVAALVEAWKWRAKVKGEWGLWSVVEVDPNDWTWRDYWEDLEVVPLVPATALQSQADALAANETELDLLRKRVDGLLTAEASLATMREALEASKRIIETLPSDHIETARANRKSIRGSGHAWWISHARFLDWVDATARALGGSNAE